jgi:hypothetical protein
MNSNYLLDRIYKGVGMTDALNEFQYVNNNGDYYFDKIVKANEYGDLIITPFDLNRKTYPVEVIRESNLETYINTHTWVYTRYCPERVKGDKKAHVPKGMTPPPFISPNIISSDSIDTIYITEGYIKSIKLYVDGLHAIGLNGIQSYKDKVTGGLFDVIHEIIKTKNVNKVCICYDADCRIFSEKHLETGKDLTSKANDFYKSFENIEKLIKLNNSNVDVLFVANKDIKFKGIDDLLIFCINL